VKDLIALAKSKPGALNYGSAGNGSDNHLTAEVFKHAAKIDAVHVPYKGGGAVMLDLLAGQIAFVFSTIPTAHSFISTGRLRALAVSGGTRNASMPDVPTVAEAGIAARELHEVPEHLDAVPGTGREERVRVVGAADRAGAHRDARGAGRHDGEGP